MPQPLWFGLVVLFGVVVGMGASFTGLGGGFLMVPALLLTGMRATETVGTSILAILITAVSALAAHARLRHVKVRVGLVLGAGGAAGAQVGARLLPLIPETGFKIIFALLMVAIALRLALVRDADPDPQNQQAQAPTSKVPGLPALLTLGVVIGVMASFTGLGGGVLMVPLAVMLGLTVPQAVGTSFLAILIISVSALTAHAGLQHVNVRIGVATGIGGIVGAQVGARLVERVNKLTFRRIFAGILIVLALRMAWFALG